MTVLLFSQLTVLGSSAALLCGFILLWRRHLPAYISAFRWQSMVLAGVTATVARFGGVPDLYVVAIVLFLVKAVAIPRLLQTTEARFGGPLMELEPYVNTATSLLVSGLLVIFGYAIARPIVAATTLPTRAGMPLAMGLLFVSLFVIVSRKKALSQVIGFLMLENAIALLAVLGTYGVPLLVELGVVLDALMGFLVMQIFVYRIHETFENIDVEQLNQLKH
jgi:hydrogenase-4 component E